MLQESIQPSKPRLTYYNARGTVLKCRLLLADLEINYQWTPLENAEEVMMAKMNAPSAKLPVWEDNLTKISGSTVILEYLGATLGRYNSSLQVQAAARSLTLLCEEVLESIWKEGEIVTAYLMNNKDATRSESILAYRQNRILPGLTILARDMLSLRNLCNEPLYTDYAILEVLYYAEAEYPEFLEKFPSLQELSQRYFSRPMIKALLQTLI